MTQESSNDKLRIEEVRGLFVLGLLAVMIVVRYQNSKLPVSMGSITFDLIPLLNMTIVLWSLYAFTMVLGLSRDVIGKTWADAFREEAKIFLRFDFILLGLFSVLLAYLAYPTRLPWMFGLVAVVIVFGGVTWLDSLRGKHLHPNLKKRIEVNSSSLSILMLLVSVAVIFYLPVAYEEYMVLPFCFGVLGIGLYFLTRKKN